MSNFLLIRHKVRDYPLWKRGYDAHQSKRAEAGLTEKQLLRSENDDSEVVILFEAKDLGRARSFTDSADLKETMQKLGVTDKPDIYFLHS